MKRRSVVAASLAMGVAAVGVAGLVRLASAEPPAGYKCGKGGTKNVAKERCDCPAGKRPSRNGDGEAVCKPKPRDDRPAAVRPPPVSDEPADTRVRACSRDMVPVPGGTFQMGSPAGVGEDDERPQHQVTLSPYCIDRTEVTVAAYEACGTCTSAAETVEWPGIDDATRKLWNDAKACNGNRADRQAHPANCITWTQADAYCRAVGKRLPTDAQWELAARGPDGRTYPWGIKDPSARRLNARGSEGRALAKRLGVGSAVMFEESDGHETTAPVGSYPDGASPYGALDMAGNVWEWVADAYEAYGAGSVRDPAPATTSKAAADKRHGLRGGGWSDDVPSAIRAANRRNHDVPSTVPG